MPRRRNANVRFRGYTATDKNPNRREADLLGSGGIIVTAIGIFLEKLEPESTEFTGWNEMKARRKLHDTISARALLDRASDLHVTS